MSIYTGILLGIISSLSATILWKTFSGSLYKFLSGGYTISGPWVSHFSPLSPSESDSIEIVIIRQFRDEIQLYLENYNHHRHKILKLKGKGKYRSAQLAAYYYLLDQQYPAVGTFILRSRDTESGTPTLQGFYTQALDRSEIEKVEIKKSKYELKPYRLTWRMRIRRIFKGSFFINYEKALRSLKNAV